MLANFISWWIARIGELLPGFLTHTAGRPRDGIVIDIPGNHEVTASIRRGGTERPIGLGAAARVAARNPVLLRPPPGFVLMKRHVVPTAPRRDLHQMLGHELSRITPFAAEDLFWRWTGQVLPGDRSRTEAVLTMVPKKLLTDAFATLESAGLKADFIEIGSAGRLILLPVAEAPELNSRAILVRTLARTCAGLAVVALGLPLVLQAYALRSTEEAIVALQPAVKQVEAMRRGLAASNGARDVMTREAERTGDLLQVLATITRILPDDSYLTDFALRERQMTISGRTAAAPRLITGLSANPTIRDPAFAAPVTRTEGATSEVFSIKAEIVR